jgi:hypothetical protein
MNAVLVLKAKLLFIKELTLGYFALLLLEKLLATIYVAEAMVLGRRILKFNSA